MRLATVDEIELEASEVDTIDEAREWPAKVPAARYGSVEARARAACWRRSTLVSSIVP